jgi:hypothetical protein
LKTSHNDMSGSQARLFATIPLQDHVARPGEDRSARASLSRDGDPRASVCGRPDDFEHDPRTVLERTAVAVRPTIGFRAQKCAQDILRAMDSTPSKPALGSHGRGNKSRSSFSTSPSPSAGLEFCIFRGPNWRLADQIGG